MATGGDLRREGDLGWSFDMFGDSPVRVGRLTYPEVGERESEIVFRRRIEEGFALGTPVSQAEWERWVRGGERGGGHRAARRASGECRRGRGCRRHRGDP